MACFSGPDFAHRHGAYRHLPCTAVDPKDDPTRAFRPVAMFEAPILQIRQVASRRDGRLPREHSPLKRRSASPLSRRVTPMASCGPHLRKLMEAWMVGAAPSSAGYPWILPCTTSLTARAARPGEMMQIIGPDVPVDEAAAAAGTIAYELLTRIGARATRTYTRAQQREPGARRWALYARYVADGGIGCDLRRAGRGGGVLPRPCSWASSGDRPPRLAISRFPWLGSPPCSLAQRWL